MSNKIRLLIGLVLVLIGVFGNSIDITPDVKSPIDISKPTESLVNQWLETSDSITDSKDRLRLCVFNKTFAERVVEYEAEAQQVNDVYVLAAKEVFGDTLRGKYDKLTPAIQSAMGDILGDENHDIIEPERGDLNKTFMAFAWCLNN
tara:strand:- start:1479 stop:1919 length:441 start_codon:yes stop_codon:yes gene_type:complete